jgi:ABC-type multidrug transport system fused ATPase/permease subunit
LEKYWGEESKKPNEKRSLWRVSALAILWLVRYLQGTENLTTTGKVILVALIFILPMTGSIFAAHSNAIFSHLGLQMRNMLISSIYRKALKLSPAARQISSTGQIVNMFSSDTAQIQRLLFFFNNTAFALPTSISFFFCSVLFYFI